MLNSKTVFEWEGLPVNEDMNIKEFFKDVVVYKLKPELWEKNCVAYFSHTKIGEMEKIGLECNTWETIKQCGKYVTFKLLDDSNDVPVTNTINTFELMRTASMCNYLPEFKLPAKNSWEQLRIDLKFQLYLLIFLTELILKDTKNQEDLLIQKNCKIIIRS